MTRPTSEHLLARASSSRRSATRSRSSIRARQFRNPVMFIVELGSVITTAIFFLDLFARATPSQLWFDGHDRHLALADRALRELRRGDRRGPRQGAGERAPGDAHDDDRAPSLGDGGVEDVPAPELQRGDVVVVEAGEIIPADGEIIEGVGSVDESAITGESAPSSARRAATAPRSPAARRLLSDQLVIEVTQEPGKSFLDRMIALVEGAERRKTPNEIALNILLAGLTITFLAAVVTLRPYALYAGTAALADRPDRAARRAHPDDDRRAALGDRHRRDGPARAAERARDVGPRGRGSGDVDVLLLDKTGTITLGNRQAAEFLPVERRRGARAGRGRQLASLADETPEGRSIVVLAKERFGLREQRARRARVHPVHGVDAMSGIDLERQPPPQGRADAVKRFIVEHGGRAPAGPRHASSRASPSRAGRRSSSRTTTGPSASST